MNGLGKLTVKSHPKKVFEQQEKIGSNTQKEYTSPREAQIGLQQSDSIPEGLSKILEHFNRLSLPSALHSQGQGRRLLIMDGREWVWNIFKRKHGTRMQQPYRCLFRLKLDRNFEGWIWVIKNSSLSVWFRHLPWPLSCFLKHLRLPFREKFVVAFLLRVNNSSGKRLWDELCTGKTITLKMKLRKGLLWWNASTRIGFDSLYSAVTGLSLSLSKQPKLLASSIK